MHHTNKEWLLAYIGFKYFIFMYLVVSKFFMWGRKKIKMGVRGEKKEDGREGSIGRNRDGQETAALRR